MCTLRLLINVTKLIVTTLKVIARHRRISFHASKHLLLVASYAFLYICTFYAAMLFYVHFYVFAAKCLPVSIKLVLFEKVLDELQKH